MWSWLSKWFVSKNESVPITAKIENKTLMAECVNLHNNMRRRHGMSNLSISLKLEKAAIKHALWMAQNQSLSHQGDHYSSVSKRVTLEGYRFTSIGENIALGYATADKAMQGWMGSTGHRNNILNPDYENIGIGVAQYRGNLYWCVVFGKPLEVLTFQSVHGRILLSNRLIERN